MLPSHTTTAPSSSPARSGRGTATVYLKGIATRRKKLRIWKISKGMRTRSQAGQRASGQVYQPKLYQRSWVVGKERKGKESKAQAAQRHTKCEGRAAITRLRTSGRGLRSRARRGVFEAFFADHRWVTHAPPHRPASSESSSSMTTTPSCSYFLRQTARKPQAMRVASLRSAPLPVPLQRLSRTDSALT